MPAPKPLLSQVLFLLHTPCSPCMFSEWPSFAKRGLWLSFVRGSPVIQILSFVLLLPHCVRLRFNLSF